jgi:hypothetical protein
MSLARELPRWMEQFPEAPVAEKPAPMSVVELEMASTAVASLGVSSKTNPDFPTPGVVEVSIMGEVRSAVNKGVSSVP